jgi:hypothetical protein
LEKIFTKKQRAVGEDLIEIAKKKAVNIEVLLSLLKFPVDIALCVCIYEMLFIIFLNLLPRNIFSFIRTSN